MHACLIIRSTTNETADQLEKGLKYTLATYLYSYNMYSIYKSIFIFSNIISYYYQL